MNTKEMAQEQISTFADSEYLADQQIDLVMAVLRQQERQHDWDIYHQIGDVLRSSDMAIKLSPDFTTRMMARLNMEPVIMVPPALENKSFIFDQPKSVFALRKRGNSTRQIKQWAMPSMIAAITAAVLAFFATPQLMVVMHNDSSIFGGVNSLVASPTPIPSAQNTSNVASTVPASSVIVANMSEGMVLRDSRIDDYLLAHQRFSPSVYSTAQYARSATFANDSNK